jgi:hypothetical protein
VIHNIIVIFSNMIYDLSTQARMREALEAGTQARIRDAWTNRNVPLPAPVGSGGIPRREPVNRKNLPNMPTLVNDIENSELLKHLLLALERHGCLESPVWKGRRSPWVKAFCDLYHPAGPWGENKFKKTLSMTSNQRYSFKATKVQKVYETLKNGCVHLQTSETHRKLLEKLEEFHSKQKYYNEYMAACKKIAEEQAKKPASERAPISSIEVVADAAVTTNNTASTTPEPSGEPTATPATDNETRVAGSDSFAAEEGRSSALSSNNTKPSAVVKSTGSKRSRSSNDESQEIAAVHKRQRLAEDPPMTRARTRSQSKRLQSTEPTGTSSTPADSASTPAAARVSPLQLKRANDAAFRSPESEIATTPSPRSAESAAATDEEEKIQAKRTKLEALLRKRVEEGNGDDEISQSIRAKKNQLDEELIALILLK